MFNDFGSRTHQETGKANWSAISEVKKNVKIPVLANGDVNSVADIQKILDVTGCDGVMIGRSALKNPWIFVRKDIDQITMVEKYNLLSDHLDLMIQFYGLKSGLILFRKYIKFSLDITILQREIRTEIYNQTDPILLKKSLFSIMESQTI